MSLPVGRSCKRNLEARLTPAGDDDRRTAAEHDDRRPERHARRRGADSTAHACSRAQKREGHDDGNACRLHRLLHP